MSSEDGDERIPIVAERFLDWYPSTIPHGHILDYGVSITSRSASINSIVLEGHPSSGLRIALRLRLQPRLPLVFSYFQANMDAYIPSVYPIIASSKLCTDKVANYRRHLFSPLCAPKDSAASFPSFASRRIAFEFLCLLSCNGKMLAIYRG
jgi:hypothetical protein